MSTYTVTLDNGINVDHNSRSAADAMQGVLEKYLGHKIKSCRLKFGGITFEVPPHKPLPLDWKPKRRTKAQDQSAPMFDDEQIRAESINAKEKAARSTVFAK
jgi:hypothetical protein